MLTTAHLAEIAAIEQERDLDPMPVYQCFKCRGFFSGGKHVPAPDPIPANLSHGACKSCAARMFADYNTKLMDRTIRSLP